METINEIKTKRDQAIEALYTEIEGQRVQKFGAEIHEQFMSEIDNSYLADLESFKQQAELDKQQAAEMKDAAFSDSTSWLNAEELARAEASAAFVREDFDRLDFDEILIRGKAAAKNRNRSLAWLYLRYMPEIETETISGSIELTRLQEQLKAIVMPEEIVKAAASSADMMLDAERRRVAAAEALYTAGDGNGPFNPFQ